MSMIRIRPLRELHEMREAVELQKTAWGPDIESLVPAHMLFSIVNCGGHVLAAIDTSSSRMVGVLVGMLGTDVEEKGRPAKANLLIASKRMVVLPEYRGRGIGYKLKLAQRNVAIKQGIRLVTWTFDPLLATNAYLNMHKLGCISRKYLENYYGTGDSGGLVTLGSSDRLFVEWWVTNRRVEERINGSRRDVTLLQYIEDAKAVIVNPTTEIEGIGHPTSELREPLGAVALLEIPVNYAEMANRNSQLAIKWREHTRAAFGHLMRAGYIVTDFLRDRQQDRDRTFYVMIYRTGLDLNLN